MIRNSHERRAERQLLIILLPSLVLLLAFVIYPALYSLYLSFTNEALTGRLIVNGGPNRNYVYTFAIPANGKYERGDVWQCAELERFDATCNHVELLVTSEFDSAFPYGTTDPFDVARMEWWVLGRARDTPNADPNDCARFPVGDEP